MGPNKAAKKHNFLLPHKGCNVSPPTKAHAVIVEFAGHAGAGKSTLCKAVGAHLVKRGLHCNLPHPPQRNAVLGRIQQRLQRRRGEGIVLPLGPNSTQALHKYGARCGHLLQCYAQARRGKGVYLIELGIMQTALALQLLTREKDLLHIVKWLGQRISFPDMIVMVDAPIAIIEQRRSARKSAFDLLYPQVTADAIAVVDNLPEVMGALKRLYPQVECLVLHNDGRSLDELAASLSERIIALTARAPLAGVW